MLRAMSGSIPDAAVAFPDAAPGSRTSGRGAGVHGYLDLHAHYLPAVDDGAGDLSATAQMVKGVVGLGFSHLFATPHQRQGLFLPTRAAILAAFEKMEGAFAAGE